MTTPCPDYEPDLSAFLDEELDEPRHREVAEHLDRCVACRRAVRTLRGLSSVLRDWDAHETRYAASNGFRNRVLERLGEEVPVEGGIVLPWRPAAAAAAVLLAAAVSAAVIVPRVGGEPEPYASGLETRVAELERRAAAADLATAETPSRMHETFVVSPLAPWQSVVAEAPVNGEGDGPMGVYERLGDGLSINSEAFLAYQMFQADLYRTLQDEVRAREVAAPEEVPTHATVSASPLATLLGRARVAEGSLSPYHQVQVWPIVMPGAEARVGPAPLTADEALRRGVLQVSEGSSADAHRLENMDRRRPVMILAGDVFEGGRRDRVAAHDVLLGPESGLTMTVHSSGSNRRASSRRFRRSGGLAPTALRALLPQGVSDEVWAERLERAVADLASPNARGTLQSVFVNDVLLQDVDRYLKQFDSRLDGPDVVGFAVAAGSEILGIEVFGDNATFRALRTRVLQSYVLEAHTRRLGGAVPGREAVVGLLADARKAIHSQWSAAGGELSTFASAGSRVFGYGLLSGTDPVHAAVFPPQALRDGGDPVARGRAVPDGGTNVPDAGGHETGPTPGGAPAGSGGIGSGSDR